MPFYDISGGGWKISPSFNFKVKTSSYTLDTSSNDLDCFVMCNATGGAFNITLPAAHASYQGRIFYIKKTDSSANAITIVGTVEGAVNPTLAAQYNSMTLTCDGTSWLTIAST